MIEQYKIIYGDKNDVYTDEIVEKKSRFIANIKKVETEQEAIAFINEMKKKYYDARHNCSAFVVGTKKELVRCNDDGEPSSTAGKPMLEVLLGSDIVNVVAVVTRYFGGTLLGKGGLVRAYTDATQAGILKCQTAIMSLGNKIKIHTDYNTIGKILHELSQLNIEVCESEYTDVITLIVTVLVDETQDFINLITEISSGKSKADIMQQVYFAVKE